MAQNQVIFTKGKEKALQSLFNNTFMYLAIGYDPQEKGFDDSVTGDIDDKGFKELNSTNDRYHRVLLEVLSDSIQTDPDTKKVLVKLKGTLDSNNIPGSKINQYAIVDSLDSTPADTTYFSAASFPTFNKTSNSSITFVIGMRI